MCVMSHFIVMTSLRNEIAPTVCEGAMWCEHVPLTLSHYVLTDVTAPCVFRVGKVCPPSIAGGPHASPVILRCAQVPQFTFLPSLG